MFLVVVVAVFVCLFCFVSVMILACPSAELTLTKMGMNAFFLVKIVNRDLKHSRKYESF
jgi:hypothetical protein